MMAFHKNWFGHFVWGAFIAFLALLITMFWYVSGILPDEYRLLLAAVLTVLTVMAVCLIAFACGRLTDFIRERVSPDPQVTGLIGDVFAGILLLGTFLVRILYLAKHTEEIFDPDGLFDLAMIGGADAGDLTDVTGTITVRLMSIFLRIAGNRIVVAGVVIALIQTIAVVAFYFAVRLLSGKLTAFLTAAVTGFAPTPFERLINLDSVPALFMLFAIALLLIAVYLHFDAKDSYNKVWQILWFAVLGLFLGYVFFADFATVILWVPLLFAFALPYCDRAQEALRLVLIFLVSLVTFVILLIVSGGGLSELRWTFGYYMENYFRNTNTVLIFHLPVDVYPVYIVLVTTMAFIIVTFWRDRRTDRTSLWLVFFLVSALIVPLFGATKLNSQELLCFGYATVIAISIACVAAPMVAKAPMQAMPEEIPEALPLVPEGMVLPAMNPEDEGEAEMYPSMEPANGVMLGLDRTQEDAQMAQGYADQTMNPETAGMPGTEAMIPEAIPEAMPAMSKAEQKAMEKAKKLQAKEEAKAAKLAAKEAKKAEKERRKLMDEAEDDYDDALKTGAIPPGTTLDDYLRSRGLLDAPEIPAAVPVAGPVPVPAAAPVPVPPVMPVPPVPPVPPVAVPQPEPAEAAKAPDASWVALAAAEKPEKPLTTRPNLVRNTVINADGQDDFDFDINGEDDFDV
ncbi:MAG: hypothetical protein IKO80_01095 [Lachnospiraceae bacterium]|nr:hypothetical protein [Lachnospiraceae bacterium]